MPLTLLTLAVGCGGGEGVGSEGATAPAGDVTQQEACLTMLHEDAHFSRELEHDLARVRQEGRETGIACLKEGAYARPDLERLGFSASEPGSIDVSNGYRATAFFADGSTRVYVDSRAELRGQQQGPELLSVKVEWCPVSVALEGQTDAQALCLELGESRLETLKTGGAAVVRELRVAPGYALELRGADGVRYHASRTVSDGMRMAAIRQPASIARARVWHIGDAAGSGVSAAAGERVELTPPEARAQGDSGEVGAMALPTPASLTNITRVVIFGDSLSDQHQMYINSGEWVPNPHHGYWDGRFTNGYNWVDYLLRDYPVLSTKIDNHAVGGAEARRDHTLFSRISLKTQASRYVDDLRRAGQLSMIGSSLFVLWGGANDVLNHVNPHSYNGDWLPWDPAKPPPLDFAVLVRNAMLDTRAIITGASGGDYGAMLFIDLPDISTVPVVRYDGWQANKTTWVNQTTTHYNQLLRDAVSSSPRTSVLRVNDFIQNWNQQRYSSPFMSDRTNSCYVGGAQDPSTSYTYVDKPCPSKMYFDKLHPTSLAQCGIAGEIADVLSVQFNTRPVGDRGARITACAQRRQSPVRAFWRDAVVVPLFSQSHAQSVCPGACTQLGGSLNESMAWNANWTNTSSGTGLCGCNSQPGQPAAFRQDAAVGSLYGPAQAEGVCPSACGSIRNRLPEGLFWEGRWTNTAPGAAVCHCTSEAPLSTPKLQELYVPQAFSDLTGDRKAEAVAFGAAHVAVQSPQSPSQVAWTRGAYFGDRGSYVADVTGDGLADAIVVNNTGITVRRSGGAPDLSGNELWADGAYFGGRGTYFADVNGDRRADAIVVNDNGIVVRRSTGSVFGPSETWSSVAYFGGRGTYFADVNGDARADAIVVNDNGIVVRRSTSTAFGPSETWSSVAYFGGRGTHFADVTGDGRADAIVVNDNGIVVRRSTGTVFGPNETWTDIAYFGAQGTYFADVDADGRADAIVVNPAITVRRSTGSSFSPNEPF